MEQEQNKSKLFEKMARVMGMMNPLPKDGKNEYHDYKYATASDVADAVRKALSEVGLAFFPNMVSVEQKPRGKSLQTHSVFEFTFADSETGATLTCRWEGEADDTGDKGISKAATAAEKYFLMKTFIISTVDEPDTDSEGDSTSSSKQSQKRTQQRPAPDPNAPYTGEINRVYAATQSLFMVNGKVDTTGMKAFVGYLEQSQVLKPDMTVAQAAELIRQRRAASAPRYGQPATTSEPQQPEPSIEANFQSADLDVYAIKNFRLNREAALKAVGKSSYEELGTPEQAVAAIKSAAYAACVPMIAYSATYVVDGSTRYVRFDTPVFTRLYNREKLRGLGEQWKQWVDTWQPGQSYTFKDHELPPLVISYEKKDGYALVQEPTEWDGEIVAVLP